MYSNFSSDYEVCFLLGKNNVSSTLVSAGKYNKTNEIVAIKKYDVDLISFEQIDYLRKEIHLMNQLKHPNVVTALTAFVTGLEIVVILPLMEYKSCADLITNTFLTGLPEIVISKVVYDVLIALKFIHEKGIIHRAVKAGHILIGLDGHAKLTGLQYAVERTCSSLNCWPKSFQFPANSVINLNWLSPEILQQNRCGYNEKSDIYSLGITICELANGFVPYSNIKLSTMYVRKIKAFRPFIYDATTIFKSQNTSDEEFLNLFNNYYTNKRFSKCLHKFKDLCLIHYPHERPSAKKLLKHKLMTKKYKENVPFRELILPAMPVNTKCFSTSIQNSDECASINDKSQDDSINTWDF